MNPTSQTGGQLSRYSLMVVAICCLAGIVEGFDYAAAAFAAPFIGRAWDVSNALIGIIFTAAGLGAILGNIFLAPLGDRWGRRPAIIFNLLLTALATCAGGLATSIEMLALTRLVCGIGVGGLYPNLIALGLEYLPTRHKALGAVIIACSMPVGLSISGFISGSLGATYGWPSIFYFSAFISAIVAIGCLALLPESPQYLIRFERHRAKAHEIMGKAFPDADQQLLDAASTQPAADIRKEGIIEKFTSLVSEKHRTTTLLIWVITFLTMCMNYFFSGWLPTALSKEGMDISAATRALSVFTIGGLAGSLITSKAQTRFSPAAALSSCYVIAAMGLLFLGQIALKDGPLLLIAMFFVGWGIFGGQFSLVVITGRYYSAEIRSTGIGAATAIGRLGGMAISLLGGVLLASNLKVSLIFVGLSAPALIALFAIFGLWSLTSRDKKAEYQTAT
ncbi:MFS transporter [Sphingobium phenoxybenzoativorans]|uniref:MFS transporter n=1 Tax=Sphingobium phenoxybenzoativorans TaxID=1592790 RepID=A0A975KAL6_9SPHN|nr:MFS transporter [Sphingobium phenoxybenzoativorans]QUT07868.1 MFS transporter [Sphingobium phenoxybenzoativorans]